MGQLEADSPLLYVLAACHSLAKVINISRHTELVGDPLELIMFGFTDWKLHEPATYTLPGQGKELGHSMLSIILSLFITSSYAILIFCHCRRGALTTLLFFWSLDEVSPHSVVTPPKQIEQIISVGDEQNREPMDETTPLLQVDKAKSGPPLPWRHSTALRVGERFFRLGKSCVGVCVCVCISSMVWAGPCPGRRRISK